MNSFFCVLFPSSDTEGHNSLSVLLSCSCLRYHSSATRAIPGACGKAMREAHVMITWEGRMDGTEEMRNRGCRRYPGSWISPQKIPAKHKFAAMKQEPLLPPERVCGCFSCPLPKRVCWRRCRSSSAVSHELSWKRQGGCVCCEKLCSWAGMVAPCLESVWQCSQQQWGSSALDCGEEIVHFLEKHYPSIPFKAHTWQHWAFHSAGRFI